MKMSLLVLAFAASVSLAAPAFAGSVASSTSGASVSGGSAGSSTVTATASDKGTAEAGDVFGVDQASSSNTATGTDAIKGFGLAEFSATGTSEAENLTASHF